LWDGIRPALCLRRLPEGDDVAYNDANLERSLEIFIDELTADEAFRESFFRNPFKTLKGANEWGLPLTDSEIRSLNASSDYVVDRVADALGSAFEEAA
jgi:hypothetical protein